MTKPKYNGQHQRERARWTPLVNAGRVMCHAVRCLEPHRLIIPGTLWDLGHNPAGTAWTGPEHARCNRSEGATRGNKERNSRPRSHQSWTL